VRSAQQAINKVLEDSCRHLREEMTELNAGRRTESGEKFDKAVEIFLFSTINTQSDQRLHSCSAQLLETVYRIEFPSASQQPQIRSLSSTCGWDWNVQDFKLADAVAQMGRPGAAPAAADGTEVTAAVTGGDQTLETAFGFNTQALD